jgi:hypothetical protein
LTIGIRLAKEDEIEGLDVSGKIFRGVLMIVEQ